MVVLPKRNKKDLEEIPKHILKGIELAFVDTMDDVMKTALRRKPSVRVQAKRPTPPQSKSQRPSKQRRATSPPRRRAPLPAVAPQLSY
jgi:ATP-dependent Lon protease